MTRINKQKIMNSVVYKKTELNFSSIECGDFVVLKIQNFEKAKKRSQMYKGIVVNKKTDSLKTTIQVRKIFQNVGVEKFFLNNAPSLKLIKIVKQQYKKF